jgi:hypothetical protein
VNAEYEVYRTDSDGDGLSDKWETLNNRNPKDGLLLFDFNNGGWQTEGWFSNDIRSNLAGFLGYLDFTLNKRKGTLSRENLAIKTTKEDKVLLLKLKSDTDLTVSVLANKSFIGKSKIKAINQYTNLEIKLSEANWKGVINSLDISFKAKKGATIEIDHIKINR